MKANIVINKITQLIPVDEIKGPRRGIEMKNIRKIEDGIIAIYNNKIIYVGSGELPDHIQTDNDTIFIDGSGKTVLPGFVDAHTHLVHGGSRENELKMKLEGMSYMEILKSGGGILSSVKATKKATEEELAEKAMKVLDRMLKMGTTTVEAKSGYGLDVESEIKQLKVANKLNDVHPVDIVSTFLGAHAVPNEYKDDVDGFVEVVINDMIPKVSEQKLATFCDVFCEEGVFNIEQSKKILEAGKEHGLTPKIHADELYPMGGAQLSAQVGALTADHLVAAEEEGLLAMQREGVIANLLPGTSFNLNVGKYACGRKMIDMGLPVALSTDYNPGSCPTENIQLIMYLASLKYKMTAEEVISAVTINGASALGLQEKIGSLETDKNADIVILDVPNIDYILYHFGINHVDTVIKNGKIVVSDRKLIKE